MNLCPCLHDSGAQQQCNQHHVVAAESLLAHLQKKFLGHVWALGFVGPLHVLDANEWARECLHALSPIEPVYASYSELWR
jgi:hypothetical protein